MRVRCPVRVGKWARYRYHLLPPDPSQARLNTETSSLPSRIASLCRGFACGVVAFLFGVRPAYAQARPDTIRGRITTDSGKGVPGAAVIATRAPDRAVYSVQADSDGWYLIVVDSGTGDYLVHASATAQPTWPAVRKRIVRQGTTDAALVLDIVIKAPLATPQQLPAVTVQTQRPKPRRGEDAAGPLSTAPGGGEQTQMGVTASVSPDLRGDLSAAAATMPGVTMTAGGISVLGLSSAQNSATLNGMAFPGASVPRAAQTFTSVATSPYDPSRGWFSGAETRVTIASGNFFSARSVRFTADAPLLQYGDPLSARMGQQYTNVIASAGGNGMLPHDRLAYNYGIDVTRHSNSALSVANLDFEALQRSGVARDSAARFLQLLSASGIPARVDGIPLGAVTNRVSFITRLNTPENDYETFEPKRWSGGIIVYGLRETADGAQASPLVTTARGGRTANMVGQVQALVSGMITPEILQEITSSIGWTDRDGTPYLRMPAANVLVTSTVADGSNTLATLGGGGSSVLASANRSLTWETQSTTSFYAPGRPRHRVKVNADIRYDATSSLNEANRDGTYAFNSLADFASNRPASFTRTLNTPERTGAAWNGFVSLGDYWRLSQRLQLLYGARIDGGTFADSPERNPLVETTFGARTDRTPASLYLSPRVGFTWVYAKSIGGYGFTTTNFGSFPGTPVGVLRGGVGEFRDMLRPGLLSDPSVSTGLPSSLRRITCVGDAVPLPDWQSYATSAGAVPSDCVGGTGIGALRDAAPAVSLLDRGFQAPRSWRANLSWTSALQQLMWSVEGVVAFNVNQPGVLDLNFANVPVFTVSGEGRPVYVRPSSIVESTGVVAAPDARLTNAFARVAATRSDLRSETRQLTVVVRPRDVRGPFWGSVAYTLADSRALHRGYDASTFGSPTSRFWSRGDLDVRHTFLIELGASTKYISVSAFSRIASGRPFTPMVGSDVNGDGFANDRAYVVDPASPGAPLATAMRGLLDGATGNVRQCLERQLGRSAEHNSCEGPWTADLNASVALNTYPLGQPWQNFSVSFNIANPLGGLDQLLHGTQLRGWGNPAAPSSVLYNVRGFDAANQRFVYQVNQKFGDTRPTATTLRAPFRVTLDIQWRYGPSTGLQQLDRWLQAGRDGRPGKRLDADELKRRYSRNVPNPYSAILQEADSLLLTLDQVKALTEARVKYAARVDSAWSALTDWMAALPDRFDAAEALKRQETAIDEVWDMGRVELQATLPRILNPLQLRMLPGTAGFLFPATEPIRGIRMFSFGR